MKHEKKSHKLVFGLAALFTAVSLIVGAGYAFFSDVIDGEGSATAGTLDIGGTVTVKQNGVTAVGNAISNLNPGDLITIDSSAITNNGSKSAWIRAVLQFTALSSSDNVASGTAATAAVGNLKDYIWVCTNGETQSALIAASIAGTLGTDTTASCKKAALYDGTDAVKMANSTFGAKTTYTAPGDVISGSAESDGSSTTWTPTTIPEIFFDASAPNTAQNGAMEFSVLIQALQYRHNTTSPTETQWSTVVDAPFAL